MKTFRVRVTSTPVPVHSYINVAAETKEQAVASVQQRLDDDDDDLDDLEFEPDSLGGVRITQVE